MLEGGGGGGAGAGGMILWGVFMLTFTSLGIGITAISVADNGDKIPAFPIEAS